MQVSFQGNIGKGIITSSVYIITYCTVNYPCLKWDSVQGSNSGLVNKKYILATDAILKLSTTWFLRNVTKINKLELTGFLCVFLQHAHA